MKVLYFTRDYTPHDFRFLNALVEIGHEVHYLRLEDSGRNLESRPLPSTVHPVEWNWGKEPFQMKDAETIVRDLKQIWDRIQPDIIHSGPLPDVSWLTAKAGLHPHAAMSWGFDLMHDIEVDPVMRSNAAEALQTADWFLGDCYVERDAAVKLGLDEAHTTIFPWGIDPRRFKHGISQVRSQIAAEQDFLMLSLRSLEPNYSVETTVRAFLQAAAVEPRLKLLMLADGSQLQSLRAIAAQAPAAIQQRINWYGRIPNEQLVDFYRASDLYLSASITDGSSVSLLEAMGCEVPVLVSAIPGNLEWVPEGKTGYLFKTGATGELAEKMLWCTQNQDALRRTAAAARQQIEEKADWDKNKFRLTEAYQGALSVSRERSGKF